MQKRSPILDNYQHLYNHHRARRSCRKDPGPVSREPLRRETPAVSYVLIPDTPLHCQFCDNKIHRIFSDQRTRLMRTAVHGMPNCNVDCAATQQSCRALS
jgi:hypothetical protein